MPAVVVSIEAFTNLGATILSVLPFSPSSFAMGRRWAKPG
jgi:hypothetical protein